MKAKVILQIVIISIMSAACIQAQENINRKVRKEMRKAKREVRKAQKEVKNSMKDIEWGAVYLDKGNLNKVYREPVWVKGDRIMVLDGHMEVLDDVLADIDDVLVNIDGITVDIDDVIKDIDLDLREGAFLYKHSPKPHVKVHTPEFHLNTPDIDLKLPEVYKWKAFEEESGNTFELSKDLDNVSITKDYFFEVKEGSASLNFSINGSLSSGELKVTVKKPDGEVYQDFNVSSLADVDWTQKLDLDEAGEGMAGKWTLSLSGSAATGSYQIRIKSK
jgi:hypothetical protein